MARASTDICGNVNSAQDIRDINRQIRGEMRADRLRIRPTQIKYRCRFCLGLVDKLPPGYEHAA